MKTKFIKSFEGRITYYLLISFVVTGVVDILCDKCINYITNQLRYMGYRSSIIGLGGVNSVFRNNALAIITGMVFVSTFYFLIRNYMKYVRRLTTAMQDIAAGNFDTEIPVETMDEFGQIAEEMIKMQGNIKKIMERERMAEHTKNDLISSVAHDLRTPLTSILGYLGWVREQPDLDVATRQKYLDIAYRKAQYLEKMTNELFGFVKMEHREMSLHIGKLDLLQLLRQLLDECYPSFEKHGLKSSLITTEEEVMMEGDGNLLARLFDNLLNNAIKYGKDGKSICVELKRKEDWVQVKVVNYGQVIPQSEISHLFRKFYRVEQSRSQNTGGTGLGLAIVEQIVQLHHGTIEVQSDLSGTVFEVSLPLRLQEDGHEC